MTEKGETYRGYEVILYDNEYGYPSEPEVFFDVTVYSKALKYARLMYPATRLVCVDYVSGGPGQGYFRWTRAHWLNKDIEPKVDNDDDGTGL